MEWRGFKLETELKGLEEKKKCLRKPLTEEIYKGK
jgi:hypothetical protein